MRRDYRNVEDEPEVTDSFVGAFWLVSEFIQKLEKKMLKYLMKKCIDKIGWGIEVMVGDWLVYHNTQLMLIYVLLTLGLIVYRTYRRTRESIPCQKGGSGGVGDCIPTSNVPSTSCTEDSTFSSDISFFNSNGDREPSSGLWKGHYWWQDKKSKSYSDYWDFSSSGVSSDAVLTEFCGDSKENKVPQVKETPSSNILDKLRGASEEISLEDAIELERPNKEAYEDPVSDVDEEAEGEYLNGLSAQPRYTIFAEAIEPEELQETGWMPPIYPKTIEKRKKLLHQVKDNLLFRELDSNQMRDVINAMCLKNVKKGEVFIKEGDDGDFFYIIDSGSYEAYIRKDGKDELVAKYRDTGYFGELALLHNKPRAATIKASSDGSLWALDRITFRKLVLKNVYAKRNVFKELIAKVPIFEMLNETERLNVADALECKTYAKRSTIIRQGDEANGMYFIISGRVRITVKDELDNDVELKVLGPGDYFGELALLTQKPRAASAYALGTVKLAFLDKSGFERLLGPCVHIMERKITTYAEEKKNMK